MILEEILIKIGVDASKAAEISGVINNLKTGFSELNNVAVTYGEMMWSAFNDAIDKAQDLALQKDALFDISEKELLQAEQYKSVMSKVGLAVDSIKTKLALGLAPAVTDLISVFSDWLITNKELIADGINIIVKVVSNIIQVIKHFCEFLDLVITDTIGWKNAIIAFIAIWALFNKAFLLSPVGLVIGAITVLLLLIDDLMVYLKGGKSLLGSYWQPLIDGAKALCEHIKLSFQFIKALWRGDSEAIKSISKKLISSLIQMYKVYINGIKTILSNLLKYIFVFFGMSESKASKTVDRIGKIFSFIFDLITLPFRNLYKAICYIMDMLGLDIGDVINGIYFALARLCESIIAPFKAAWELVSSLFDIWEDDTTTFINKIGQTFKAILTFLLFPFVQLWQNIKGLGKAILELFELIINGLINCIDWVIGKIIETCKDIFAFITSTFTQFWQYIKDGFEFLVTAIETIIQGLGKAFLQLFDLIINGLINCIDWVIGKIIETCKDIFAFITSTFTQFWQYIKDGFEFLVTAIETIIQGLGKTFLQLFDLIISGLMNSINWVIDKISKTCKDIFAYITSTFTQSWQYIKDGFEFLVTTIETTIQDLGKAFLQLVDLIISPFRESFDWVIDKISKTCKDIFAYITSTFTQSWQYIKDGFEFLVTAIKSIIQGLGKAFLELFDLIINGLMNSIDWVIDKISKTFKAIFTPIKSAFTQSWQYIKAGFEFLVTTIKTIIQDLGKVFLQLVDLIISPFRESFDWVIDKISKTFKDIFTLITSPFTQSWQYIKDEFEVLVTTIETTIEDLGKTFSGLFELLTSPFRKSTDWIKDNFLGVFNETIRKVKKVLSILGLYSDDEDEKQIKPNLIKHPNSLNTNTANAAMGSVSSKVNNNAVTINNTMNVTTPQEGFDNLNNLAKNEIQNVADNTQTALGAY